MSLSKVHSQTKQNQINIYILVNLLHGPSGSKVPADWHGMGCRDQHIARGSQSQEPDELALVRWVHTHFLWLRGVMSQISSP